MIAYIKGIFVQIAPTTAIIETSGGVAYVLHISLHTYSKIQSQQQGKLFAYFHVKEDAQTLYGFAEEAERELFALLISVSGVGPSTAQIMLSSLSAQELQQAIVQENVGLIKSVKGIGLKTAQKIIIELKDKLAKNAPAWQATAGQIDNKLRDEALYALAALGIDKNTAQKAINKALQAAPDIHTVEQLIKAAFKNIS